MGPRSDERGNDRCLRKALIGESSSMGPRSDERGNTLSEKMTAYLWAILQWGRAQMSAEIQFPTPYLYWPNNLQWGRAQMSAEMAADATLELSYSYGWCYERS